MCTYAMLACMQVVWLMEPDYHQYSEATQEGGGLGVSVNAAHM